MAQINSCPRILFKQATNAPLSLFPQSDGIHFLFRLSVPKGKGMDCDLLHGAFKAFSQAREIEAVADREKQCTSVILGFGTSGAKLHVLGF